MISNTGAELNDEELIAELQERLKDHRAYPEQGKPWDIFMRELLEDTDSQSVGSAHPTK